MDEYFLEDDEIPEHLVNETERLAIVQSNHYVYFDKDTEEIYAISTEKLSQFDHFFEIATANVSNILENGNLEQYKVKFNSDENPTIILKPKKDVILPNLIKVPKVENWDSELTIEQYPFLGQWAFHLRNDKREKFKSLAINSKLNFFIVDADNKNFIVHTITFNFQELCDNERVYIPFTHFKEEDVDVNVCTKSIFKTIGLRRLYDTKN